MNDQSESEPEGKMFPWAPLPALLVDRLTHIDASTGVARLFFARFDPPTDIGPERLIVPVAQLVMTIETLANTASFFEAVMEDAIRNNNITAEQYEAIKQQTKASFSRGTD